MTFFTETEKKNHSKIHLEPQKPQIARTTLRKKNKVEGLTLPDFKLYYEAVEIKTVWCWHKKTHR